MQFCRLLPGAEVSLVIEIYPVSNRIIATVLSQCFHYRKKFILALKAALAVVANVIRTIQFRGIDHFKWKALLICECDSIGQLSTSQTGRIRDDRQHLVTKGPVRGPGQICGIHASRICDQQAAKSKQLAL